jgi:hypothetical protein
VHVGELAVILSVVQQTIRYHAICNCPVVTVICSRVVSQIFASCLTERLPISGAFWDSGKLSLVVSHSIYTAKSKRQIWIRAHVTFESRSQLHRTISRVKS